MVTTNPLANAMTTINNNEMRKKRECIISPASKLVGHVLRVLQKNGYVGEFEFIDDGQAGKFKVQLLGRVNKCGIDKGRHPVKFEGYEEWEKRYLPSHDMGLLIISSSKGVLAHKEAKENRMGGRLLAYVY
ncbi:MAG TPA: 30S ribosomal protein S8 [Candidatus Bathyarchaeia archaeon]|nr:30S ribosomal protein S8, small subunit ribosomal protein S8 [uncultured archaeon]OGD46332.1 MAG: 30S ribosomal protein S8 [Candidatus Bathyarchaeota archaeon RBG_16_48_13]HJX23897.1 30S ribosomal protein S8 [Candidatus Bathyarchaeia archaeon]